MAEGGQSKPSSAREPEKKRRRRPAKNGRRKKAAATERPEEHDSNEADESEDQERAGRGRPGRGRAVWLGLLTVGLVELWLFGQRGHIEVCVGREGEHDFGLIGQPRTEDNTRSYPSCETRLNLGLKSRYKEAHDDALIRACQRATILRGKDVTIACALGLTGWQQRTETAWCPPWHDHYYRRLFWFAVD